MESFAFFNNHIPPVFIDVPNGVPAPCSTMWMKKDRPRERTFMHSYPLLTPNQPSDLPDQQRIAYPVTPYDIVEVHPQFRIPRYVVGPVATLVISPASSLIPAEELVPFAPIASHGPTDELRQISIIECQRQHAPQESGLILLAKPDFFDRNMLHVPNPCYTGEGYRLMPMIAAEQFDFELDEEEEGGMVEQINDTINNAKLQSDFEPDAEESGRMVKQTATPISDTINNAVNDTINHTIHEYVGKQPRIIAAAADP
jgi:hypothetical protein